MTRTDLDTIRDFGAQWTRYSDNEGYYGSVELLADIIEPLLPVADIADARVADIGSGTGRIVNMLLAAGARSVLALEPSEAMSALKENTAHAIDRVSYVQATGEKLPLADYDIVISLGVLHHVVDVDPIMQRAFAALKPGGRMLAWLYGREGNGVYLAIFRPLRALTKRLPDSLLSGLCHLLTLLLDIYILGCRWLPLPLRGYMLGHMAKLTRHKKFLTVFDQLNPAYAKYYRREEAIDLFRRAGFVDIRVHHRHGYSWTVVGSKPLTLFQ